jgi:hypothetical protein
MTQCDDYPCCGHTDGDGCQTLDTHSADYWRTNPHLSCQHEIGICELDEWGDEDDEDELEDPRTAEIEAAAEHFADQD